jgi:hypothetical protein
LLSKGKAPKLALVAVMRKLLTVLNAIARTKQTWTAPLPAWLGAFSLDEEHTCLSAATSEFGGDVFMQP